ncbi:hypothetical protein BC941DRAFT_438600 [Chlamydoabsidia padenii]|nr:hypothetical protein BC941DRAFT_438600 [Chlamydoabsidia padenii]
MSLEDPGTPVPRKMSIQQQQQLCQNNSTISTADDDETDNDDPNSSYSSTLNPITNSTTSLPENCSLASAKDNAYFHALFKSVPEHDRLLEIYKCALHRDILLQGHLYLSENYVCFHANIFGWITNLVIEYNEIVLIERKMTAMIIPNGIQINTQHAKHTFASFIFREAAYQQLTSLWAIHKPQQLRSSSAVDEWDTTSDEDCDSDSSTTTDTDTNSIQQHHHQHHHNHKDTSISLMSSLYSSWKGLVVILLLLHSGWMIRQWMRLGDQLQQTQSFDDDPTLSYFDISQHHHIYSQLDQLRQRMEILNQQILQQQLLLYDLSPHQENEK